MKIRKTLLIVRLTEPVLPTLPPVNTRHFRLQLPNFVKLFHKFKLVCIFDVKYVKKEKMEHLTNFISSSFVSL